MAAALSAIALTLAWFLLPESIKPGSKSAARRMLDSSALRNALATPSVGPLLLTQFILVLAFANFETTLALLLKGEPGSVTGSPFQFTFREVLYTFAYIGITLSLVQGLAVRKLAGRVPETVLATGGAIGEVVGFCVMIGAIGSGSRWEFILALTIVVAGFAFMMPSLTSLISRRSDPTKQGGILGLGQSVSALARILGPMLGVPLLKLAIRLPYIVAGSTMALGLLMIVYSGRRGRDYGPAPAAVETLEF